METSLIVQNCKDQLVHLYNNTQQYRVCHQTLTCRIGQAQVFNNGPLLFL